MDTHHVCKNVLTWIDMRHPDVETRTRLIEHFDGWPEEKQNEMAWAIERKKFEEMCVEMERLLKPTLLERLFSWTGLV